MYGYVRLKYTVFGVLFPYFCCVTNVLRALFAYMYFEILFFGDNLRKNVKVLAKFFNEK
jgi:hypothetical protein